MIDNNGSGPSTTITTTTTATVTDPSNNNTSLLFDTTNLSAPAEFQDPHWAGSNSNNHDINNNNNSCNENEQNKRKRNGSLDSVEALEHSVAPSQRDQQEVLLDDSLSLDDLRKPGRKPLTESVFDDDDEDPKVKRKVQNRAAQRAFRERKERYVRELEIKIRQIQNQHLHTTAQLSQENQYLRAVIHRLKAELCTLKGLPLESGGDVIPPLPAWQHATSAQTPSAAPLSSDLAPFLTLGGAGGPHSPITPTLSRPRPVAIAPRGTPPSPAKRPIAAAKRRPVPTLPQKQETKKSTNSDQRNDLVQKQHIHQHQLHQYQHSPQHQVPQQQYLPNNNNAFSSSSTPFSDNNNSSASSHPALYVQFSPEEKPQDDFTTATAVQGRRCNIPSADAYLSSDKQDTTEKNAVVQEDESQRTRVQTVWRRLNLYGRFSDFDFDQLSRVAQMADHRDGAQMSMGGGVPVMEDWELDKLMLQIDSDHL
ncbi:hypothetical protein BDB00DRAFT_783030 [Zychaea mexicana]|uniref:uncharacterized protein n=1 Tax=Zychaea mexicana TaxID=64656 RepID=UPI0022FE739F|nr:uncharacterized protein BDB00DRAFT_783030 [Zychaea mexicana]KAI9499534.1 hypothetical protein BDB00DRAFT_783030 [Zychaea mexicana]